MRVDVKITGYITVEAEDMDAAFDNVENQMRDGLSVRELSTISFRGRYT